MGGGWRAGSLVATCSRTSETASKTRNARRGSLGEALLDRGPTPLIQSCR
jgi:hypothetical protein